MRKRQKEEIFFKRRQGFFWEGGLPFFENEGSSKFWGKETHLREIFFYFRGEEVGEKRGKEERRKRGKEEDKGGEEIQRI